MGPTVWREYSTMRFNGTLDIVNKKDILYEWSQCRACGRYLMTVRKTRNNTTFISLVSKRI